MHAIVSITTDLGTERGLIKLPYMVDAFFKWLGGADVSSLAGTIDADNSRFFKSPLPLVAGRTYGQTS